MNYENDLHKKLFEIVKKPSRLKSHPFMVVPSSFTKFSKDDLFKSDDSIHILELGSGWGEFALAWLEKNPTHEWLALEVKPDRIRNLQIEAEKKAISGLRILQLNFSWFLEELLPDNSFDLIIVNFPDPWPKRRHWKHRLVQSDFPARIAPLLRPGGKLHLATDYSPYARRMLSVMRKTELFEPVFTNPDYRRERPDDFPPTKFERSQIAQGYQPYFQQWTLVDTNSKNTSIIKKKMIGRIHN